MKKTSDPGYWRYAAISEKMKPLGRLWQKSRTAQTFPRLFTFSHFSSPKSPSLPGFGVALYFVLLLLPSLLGCSATILPRTLAEDSGLDERIFSGEYFDILGYMKGADPVLHVYIEGDGKAWLNRRRPSSNPTPKKPIALRMAATDSHNAVLYLSRPCQFVEGDSRRSCIMPFWTSARFSEPVVSDLNRALETAKQSAKATSIKIVGYSGGGALALLLAARRTDVDVVITVAGNLDHAFWTEYHRVSPLRDSLNPVQYAGDIGNVRQVHIVGTDDKVIPPSVAQSYAKGLEDMANVRIVEIEDIGHTDDWHVVFPDIIVDLEREQ